MALIWAWGQLLKEPKLRFLLFHCSLPSDAPRHTPSTFYFAPRSKAHAFLFAPCAYLQTYALHDAYTSKVLLCPKSILRRFTSARNICFQGSLVHAACACKVSMADAGKWQRCSQCAALCSSRWLFFFGWSVPLCGTHGGGWHTLDPHWHATGGSLRQHTQKPQQRQWFALCTSDTQRVLHRALKPRHTSSRG